MAAGGRTNREQAFDALRIGLADPQQQPGCERHVGAAGILDDPQAHRGILVGGAVVRLALFREQPGRGGLEHHAHRRRNRLQPLDLLPGHHPGVHVHQEAGLLHDANRHGAKVGDGGVVAVGIQPLASLRPALLGAIAEREEHLFASECSAVAGHLENLVRRHEHLFALAFQLRRRLDEGTVVAAILAQVRDRDEDFARVRDDAGPTGLLEPGIPHPARRNQQPVEVAPARMKQCFGFGRVNRHAGLGTLQRARQCGCRWYECGGGIDSHDAAFTSGTDFTQSQAHNQMDPILIPLDTQFRRLCGGSDGCWVWDGQLPHPSQNILN